MPDSERVKSRCAATTIIYPTIVVGGGRGKGAKLALVATALTYITSDKHAISSTTNDDDHDDDYALLLKLASYYNLPGYKHKRGVVIGSHCNE